MQATAPTTTARQVKLSEVRQGDYIRRKPDAKVTFRKGHFDRSSKTFALADVYDMNREIFLKGSTVVYIGFEF